MRGIIQEDDNNSNMQKVTSATCSLLQRKYNTQAYYKIFFK